MAPKPNPKDKPTVDLQYVQLLTVQLLDGLCDEVWRATPSHSWDKLKTVREEIKALRSELESFTKV